VTELFPDDRAGAFKVDCPVVSLLRALASVSPVGMRGWGRVPYECGSGPPLGSSRIPQKPITSRYAAQESNPAVHCPKGAYLAGTFAPFFRAFERPIAIACFRLFAFPDLPLFCVPALVFFTAFFTSFFAAEPYLAMGMPFQKSLSIGARRRLHRRAATIAGRSIIETAVALRTHGSLSRQLVWRELW
jgi:hypothetical protein